MNLSMQSLDQRSVHSWGAVGLLFTASLFSGSVNALSLAQQIALLSLGVAVLGIPHGAFDPFVGRLVFEYRHGASWAAVFGAWYLLWCGLVLVVWTWAPGVALALFLLGSLYHFGIGDERGRRGALRNWEAAASGSAVIMLPAATQDPQAIWAFSLLSQHPEADVSALLKAWSPALWAAWAIPTAATLGGRLKQLLVCSRKAPPAQSIAETIAVAVLFLRLDSLVAFGIYFCFVHSPRHMFDLVERRAELFGVSFSARRVAAIALVMTAIPVVGGVLALAYAPLGVTIQESAVRVIFIGLSILTVPHMILSERAQGAELRPMRP